MREELLRAKTNVIPVCLKISNYDKQECAGNYENVTVKF